MKPKQIIISVLVTCLIIVPKELFFKPENFWINMLLNVAGFMIGGVTGVLLSMKKKNVPAENAPLKDEAPLPSLPDATKPEDYSKYMRK